VDLPFNSDVISTDANRADGSFDSENRTYPAEQLPATLTVDGIEFKLGSGADGQKNAVACQGQSIPIPPGGFERAYILAAADGDQKISIDAGGKPTGLTIQDWTGYVGQWDNRHWLGEVPELASQWHNALGGLMPGFVKPAEVAWFATHRHHPTIGNEPYRFSYIFKYALDLPGGAGDIKLPENDKVKIFAISLVKNDHNLAKPIRPLHDTLEDHVPTGKPTMTLTGPPNDVCYLTLNYPLYWRDQGLHYTLDGSEPTEHSTAWDGKPIALYRATTVKAKAFLSSNESSQTLDCNIPVNDTTPPSVLSATTLASSTMLYVSFSEPVEKSTAESPANYKLAGNTVKSATLWDDGRMVSLTLEHPVSDAASEQLLVANVKDLSPASNAMAEQRVDVKPVQPVFKHADEISAPMDFDAKDLPLHAGDSWTLSLMLKIDHQPANRTLIAGFGALRDETGHGRYLSKFANGIHFWASRADGETPT